MGDRLYPDRPMVGVGVVVWRDDRVLLVKRGRAPMAGQWALPGGAQALGETLFEAAIREVREETAIVIRPYRIITALDLIEREGDRIAYHYTLIEIAADFKAGEIVVGDDAADAGWFEPDEIARMDAWDQVEKMVRLSQLDHHLEGAR
jgi:ADP-ribose pyrophosphatase YjhB (NUDIX family)